MKAKNMLKLKSGLSSPLYFLILNLVIFGALSLFAGCQDEPGEYGGYEENQQQYESGKEEQTQQRGKYGQYKEQQQQEQKQKTEYSDQEIKSFAKAYSQVKDIQKDYSQEISQISDKQKAQKLQDKYSSQMISKIKDEGLTVQKYNQISQSMTADEELREKVQKMIE